MLKFFQRCFSILKCGLNDIYLMDLNIYWYVRLVRDIYKFL